MTAQGRKKPGWKFWTALSLSLGFVLYPLSTLPYIVLTHAMAKGGIISYDTAHSDPVIYAPLFWIEQHGPPPIATALYSYWRASEALAEYVTPR